MTSQHLSDEAVAAFADGVLRGHARERAARHVENCLECREAVRIQREAAWALRSAPLPALPVDLTVRLRSLPITTPVPAPPTVVGPDGSAMLATFAGAIGPSASFVPTQRRTIARVPGAHLGRPLLTAVAAVAIAGGAVVGSIVAGAAGTSGPPAGTSPGTVAGSGTTSGSDQGITPRTVGLFRDGNRP